MKCCSTCGKDSCIFIDEVIYTCGEWIPKAELTKKEMAKLRSSVLHKDEILYVTYSGPYGNFPKGVKIEAKGRMATRSGLPYPQPKWEACDYYIRDTDGDSYPIARERFGKLEPGFEWVREEE